MLPDWIQVWEQRKSFWSGISSCLEVVTQFANDMNTHTCTHRAWDGGFLVTVFLSRCSCSHLCEYIFCYYICTPSVITKKQKLSPNDSSFFRSEQECYSMCYEYLPDSAGVPLAECGLKPSFFEQSNWNHYCWASIYVDGCNLHSGGFQTLRSALNSLRLA